MNSFTSIVSFFVFISFTAFSQFPTEKIMGSNETPTYEEIISFYNELSKEHLDIQIFEMGSSDYGLPIYVCVLNLSSKDSLEVFEGARSSTTMLINNAIHPGEPCGVNASMKLALDFSEMNKKEKRDLPVIAIIPAYNVGGVMNRGSFSRANQDGPEMHGFRGNASNLDLNRDFVKMDSKNMFTFAKIFHSLNPDIFIDTHTSNGADYQYTLTYITPVMEKLAPSLRSIFEKEMIPTLKEEIRKNWNFDLFPYVNLAGRTPDDGMVKFNATPRYSMGYTDLFNCISFTTETHMLKPFEDRVKSTYAFLIESALFAKSKSILIEEAREEAFAFDRRTSRFYANFELDTIPDSILFSGYNWNNVKSEITVGDRLMYMQEEPMETVIPYYLHYLAQDSLRIPSFYVVGKQAEDVINRLRANGIETDVLESDTVMPLESFKVVDYETVSSPYEGHYLHSDVKYDLIRGQVHLKKGDVIVSTDQVKVRFIVKLLSPEYVDSYFNWNFFDSYLQQKEHFSSYVFEDIAVRILAEDEELNSTF